MTDYWGYIEEGWRENKSFLPKNYGERFIDNFEPFDVFFLIILPIYIILIFVIL